MAKCDTCKLKNRRVDGGKTKRKYLGEANQRREVCSKYSCNSVKQYDALDWTGV